VGLLGVVALFVVAVIKKRQRPELSDGVIVFLAAAGISSGVKVFHFRQRSLGNGQEVEIFSQALSTTLKQCWQPLTRQRIETAGFCCTVDVSENNLFGDP